METIYKKEEFEGYTHRFKVEFLHKSFGQVSLDIYTNNGNLHYLHDFIERNKKPNVTSFKVINKSTKEQDDATSEMLKEFLGG